MIYAHCLPDENSPRTQAESSPRAVAGENTVQRTMDRTPSRCWTFTRRGGLNASGTKETIRLARRWRIVGVSFSMGFSSMDFPAQKRMGRVRFWPQFIGPGLAVIGLSGFSYARGDMRPRSSSTSIAARCSRAVMSAGRSTIRGEPKNTRVRGLHPATGLEADRWVLR